MNPQSTFRASDADRDAVSERLCRATMEGRLEYEELEERLGAALSARTYGELERLLADLPAVPAMLPRARKPTPPPTDLRAVVADSPPTGVGASTLPAPLAAPRPVRILMLAAHAAIPLLALAYAIRELFESLLPAGAIATVGVLGIVAVGVLLVVFWAAATLATSLGDPRHSPAA